VAGADRGDWAVSRWVGPSLLGRLMVPTTVTVYSVPGSSPMIVHVVASTRLTLQERPPGAAVAVERQDVPGPAPWVQDCATGALHAARIGLHSFNEPRQQLFQWLFANADH
jgi:hypothetical protein